MKMLWVLLSISLTFAEKLERKYLPPPGSASSGLNAVDIPERKSSKDEEVTTIPELVIGIDRETFSADNTFEQISKNINNNLTQYNDQTSSLNIPSIQTLEKIQRKTDREAFIINYDQTLTPEGYAYSYDTSNGIHGEEKGIATNGVRAKGSYSYIGDDGNLYQVGYTADENGFVPKGAHLPTPPPIPDAILRVIEIAMKNKEAGIYDDGSYNDEKYGYKNYLSKYPQTHNILRGASNSREDGNNILKSDHLKKFSSRFSVIDQDKEIKENKTDMVTTPIPFLTPYVSRIDDDDLESSDIDEQSFEKQENPEDDDSDYVHDSENPYENSENDSIWSNKLEGTSSTDKKLTNAPKYGDRIRNNNELSPSDEKDGYVYKKGNQLFISPRISNTTSTAVPTEFPARVSTLTNTAEKNQTSFVTPTRSNKSLFDISTKPSNYPVTAQTVISFVDTNFTSITPGLMLTSKSAQTLTPGRKFSSLYRPINGKSNYPIIYNVQTSTEIIIGEEFNEPEQPQRLNPITRYHY